MAKPLEDEEEDEEAEEAEDEDLEPGDEVESSLEELVAKRVDKAEEEDDSVLDLSPDDRIEPLSIRTVPPQANEFICRNCHLVKRNSQLADRRRKLCLDCV